MLRESGMEEDEYRYYATSEIDSWPKLLATLTIVANESIDMRTTLEEHNARNQA